MKVRKSRNGNPVFELENDEVVMVARDSNTKGNNWEILASKSAAEFIGKKYADEENGTMIPTPEKYRHVEIMYYLMTIASIMEVDEKFFAAIGNLIRESMEDEDDDDEKSVSVQH